MFYNWVCLLCIYYIPMMMVVFFAQPLIGIYLSQVCDCCKICLQCMINITSRPTDSRDHEVLSIDDEGEDDACSCDSVQKNTDRIMSCVGSQPITRNYSKVHFQPFQALVTWGECWAFFTINFVSRPCYIADLNLWIKLWSSHLH
jgi:hypothetical protein